MTKSRGILARRRTWTGPEIALLQSMYPHCHTADVGEWLGRTMSQCYVAATAQGLRKSPEYLASVTSGRIQRGHVNANMMATQFKPGFTPWNKGTHYVAGGRSAETRFKKGQMAGAAMHNYVPIGSLRVNDDGYLERKITDDPSLMPARRWVAEHRLVWQREVGPIPPGHLIRFKPGQRTAQLHEITVDRLECITRAEHARRNHPRNKSPELAALVQLKGAITRQVNRITREAHENRT